MILRHLVLVLGLLATSGCGPGASPSPSPSPTPGIPVPVQQTALASSGGIRIDKPGLLAQAGAECIVGTGANAGDVAFGFPTRSQRTLAFTLGPLRDGLSPGQENNRAYSGAGSYDNIGIAGKLPDGSTFVGFGTITVNADQQTGTFALKDGSASGSWDCGHRLG